MSRHAGRRRQVTAAAATAKWARDAWAAHEKLCWRCHSAAGHPGLYCDGGFQLARELSRARAGAALAEEAAARAQGRLL